VRRSHGQRNARPALAGAKGRTHSARQRSAQVASCAGAERHGGLVRRELPSEERIICAAAGRLHTVLTRCRSPLPNSLIRSAESHPSSVGMEDFHPPSQMMPPLRSEEEAPMPERSGGIAQLLFRHGHLTRSSPLHGMSPGATTG